MVESICTVGTYFKPCHSIAYDVSHHHNFFFMETCNLRICPNMKIIEILVYEDRIVVIVILLKIAWADFLKNQTPDVNAMSEVNSTV